MIIIKNEKIRVLKMIFKKVYDSIFCKCFTRPHLCYFTPNGNVLLSNAAKKKRKQTHFLHLEQLSLVPSTGESSVRFHTSLEQLGKFSVFGNRIEKEDKGLFSLCFYFSLVCFFSVLVFLCRNKYVWIFLLRNKARYSFLLWVVSLYIYIFSIFTIFMLVVQFTIVFLHSFIIDLFVFFKGKFCDNM